ncbi:hypothetical protein EDC01DRAFT_729569 [Geopyxis carbonaria]|nr:hypothetical protein EDC01DRAFT_729569 [Geopyxis carbonaria]
MASVTSAYKPLPSPPLWRPLSIRAPTSLLLLSINLLVIVAIEVSLRTGPLYIRTDSSFPPGIIFAFEYAPTIASILIGLSWMLVDTDVKRLECFFQLSNPQGVAAQDSLFLDYPSMVGVFVPYLAAARGHWVVAISATVMIVTAFGVTPLMSAVLGQEVVRIVQDETVRTREILPVSQQAQIISPEAVYSIYRWQFMGEALPQFATETTGVLPFELLGGIETELTVNTTQYEAELDCVEGRHKRALVIDDHMRRLTVTIDNPENKCQATIHSNDQTIGSNSHTQFDGPASQNYTGIFQYSTNKKNDNRYQLPLDVSLPDCNGTFLALWNRQIDGYDYTHNFWRGDQNPNQNLSHLPSDIPKNFTAVFCRPKYYQQAVRVKVDGRGAIHQTHILAPRQPFDGGVNSTFFEEMFVLGSIDNTFQRLPNPESRMRSMAKFRNKSWFVNYQQSQFNFAIARAKDFDEIMDGKILRDLLNKAFKTMFAFNVVTQLSQYETNEQGNTRLLLARVDYKRWVYQTDSVWGRVLQAALCVNVVLMAVFTVMVWRRPLTLVGEPDSLASVMRAVAYGRGLLADFEGSEIMGNKELAARLEGNRYKLEISSVTGKHGLVKSFDAHRSNDVDRRQPKDTLEAERPWEIQLWFGGAVGFVLIGTTVGLIVLRALDVKYDGLPRPTNTFLRNLAYSYTPTFLASGFEAFFVMVSRFVALVMPFQAMKDGPAPPHKSITAHYERRPPHLIVYAAVSKGHYVLAGLGAAILLSNVLAVALGGLFLPHETSLQRKATFLADKAPIIDSQNLMNTSKVDYKYFFQRYSRVTLAAEGLDEEITRKYELDIFYQAITNLTSTNLTYTPWTSSEYYFLPVEVAPEDKKMEANDDRISNSTAETWGFGATLDCRSVDLEKGKVEIDGIDFRSMQIVPRSLCTPSKLDKVGAGEVATMAPYLNPYDFLSLKPLKLDSSSDKYMESPLWPFDGFATNCTGIFAASWMKYTLQNQSRAPEDALFQSTLIDTVSFDTPLYIGAWKPKSAVNLLCSPVFTMQRFTVQRSTASEAFNYTPLAEPAPAHFSPLNSSDPTSVTDFIGLDTDKFEQQLVERYKLNITGLNLDAAVTPSKILAWEFQKFLFTQNPGVGEHAWEGTPTIKNWLTHIMSLRHTPPAAQQAWYSDPAAATTDLSAAYAQLYALWLRTYADRLFPHKLSPALRTPGTLTAREARMALTPAMFAIATTALLLMAAAMAATYVRRPGRWMRRVPTALGYTIPLLYGSPLVAEGGVEESRRGGRYRFEEGYWRGTRETVWEVRGKGRVEVRRERGGAFGVAERGSEDWEMEEVPLTAVEQRGVGF